MYIWTKQIISNGFNACRQTNSFTWTCSGIPSESFGISVPFCYGYVLQQVTIAFWTRNKHPVGLSPSQINKKDELVVVRKCSLQRRRHKYVTIAQNTLNRNTNRNIDKLFVILYFHFRWYLRSNHECRHLRWASAKKYYMMFLSMRLSLRPCIRYSLSQILSYQHQWKARSWHCTWASRQVRDHSICLEIVVLCVDSLLRLNVLYTFPIR